MEIQTAGLVTLQLPTLEALEVELEVQAINLMFHKQLVATAL